MVIDEETRRTIIDLYANQHKTIRQITKITRKSSRDITAILKERNRISRTQAYDIDEKNQGLDSIEEPLNVKAYRLFSQGKNPVEVLKRTEAFRNRDNQIFPGVFETQSVTWTFFDFQGTGECTCS